jgi:hypothetical protein
MAIFNPDPTETLIRVAWYDRVYQKYDFGAWKDDEKIETMRQWITQQNTAYPHVKYWLEEKDGNSLNAFPKNVVPHLPPSPEPLIPMEEFVLIRVKSMDRSNETESVVEEGEYCEGSE